MDKEKKCMASNSQKELLLTLGVCCLPDFFHVYVFIDVCVYIFYLN